MANRPVTWNGTDAQGNPLRWDSGLSWNGFLPTPPKKPMLQIRVLLGFAAASDHSLEETAASVLSKLYDNPAFANPPVAKVDLQAALTAFSLAIAASLRGGPVETADKNNKREALVSLLRQLAGFVQDKHDNDLAKLLSSGFEAVSTNRASAQLEQPSIKDILNGIGAESSDGARDNGAVTLLLSWNRAPGVSTSHQPPRQTGQWQWFFFHATDAR
jgi:hypothetical protein